MSTTPPGPDWQPVGDPLVPADLGGWFERVVGVVRRSWVPLLVIQVGVAVVGAVCTLALRGLDSPAVGRPELGTVIGFSLLGIVVLIAVSVFAQGASVYVAIRDAAGEQTTPEMALGFAATRALPLLGWGIVAGLLTVLGFVALIVPGIYLAIVFYATLAGVIIVERGGIGRCFTLVNRRFWPTAGRVLLYVLIFVIYSVVIGGVVGLLVGADSAVAAVLQQVLNIPLGLAGVGVAVVTYAELRFHERPDVLTPTLAAELRQ